MEIILYLLSFGLGFVFARRLITLPEVRNINVVTVYDGYYRVYEDGELICEGDYDKCSKALGFKFFTLEDVKQINKILRQ